MNGGRSSPGGVALADGVAVRALTRCAAVMAIAAACLAVMSLLFLRLADDELGARSLPQIVVLGWGQVVALGAAVGCTARARAVRLTPGTGPGHAAGAGRLLGHVVLAAPVGAGLLAAACVVTLTPRAESLLSAVLALAVVAQVAVLALVQRGLLRRPG